ncbi:MAG TPA: NADH-quinone oxidoreductase subunit C, partial [Actinomycetota bacterium]|nr:NADH-quinone oxidoreductase subunit C [Actinomycetota bacterium]
MRPEDLAERLRGAFDDVLLAHGEVTVTVDRDRLLDALRTLCDEDDLRFAFLSDVSCTDWPGREPRIWMAYHLRSHERNHRVRVKVGLPEEDLRVPSAVPVFPAAEWQEREVFDMFGVTFDGHPDLRRVLMPDDWEGYPLRKDHPLGGVPTQYKGAFVP